MASCAIFILLVVDQENSELISSQEKEAYMLS
jgi:hypothetical protein